MRVNDQQPRSADHGAIAILVAVFALVIFVLGALVVDLGFARETRREAQNTADAASLAGAGELYSATGGLQPQKAIAAVKQYAKDDLGVLGTDWPSCSTTLPVGWSTSVVTPTGTVSSGTNCIAFYYDSSEGMWTKVQVVTPVKRTGVFFGGIVGYGGSPITALAQAETHPTPGLSLDCLLCVLNNFAGQIGDIVVDGGSVSVNGAITFNNATGHITVTGGGTDYFGSWNGKGTISPPPTHRSQPLSDPFVSLQLPPVGTNFTAPVIAGAGTCSPGNFSDVSGCTAFNPGIYVITGDAKLTGQSSLTASNVLFYFTCSENRGTKKNPVIVPKACASGGEDGATFGGAGNGTVVVNGLTSGPYQGFAMIWDRNNTADQTYVGNGNLTVHGAMYAANADSVLDDRGNGQFVGYGPVVVGGVELKGNGSAKLHMTIHGADTVTVPTGSDGPLSLVK